MSKPTYYVELVYCFVCKKKEVGNAATVAYKYEGTLAEVRNLIMSEFKEKYMKTRIDENCFYFSFDVTDVSGSQAALSQAMLSLITRVKHQIHKVLKKDNPLIKACDPVIKKY